MARLLALLGVALLLAGCTSLSSTQTPAKDAAVTSPPPIGTVAAGSTPPSIGTPAHITLASASLDQSSISTGEQTHLSVALANAGGAGKATLRLVLDGAPSGSVTDAALADRESATFTLAFVLHEAGTHHVGLLLDGAPAALDLVLSVAEPARFSLTSLAFSPATPELGDAVTLAVNVTNVGDRAGSVLVDIARPAALTPAQSVTLVPGQSQRLTFNLTASAPGDVPVTVALKSATGTLEGTLHVKQPLLRDGTGQATNAPRCANAATWVMGYANNGDGVARGLVATVTLADASGNVAHTETLAVPDLAHGQTTTYPITLHMATSCSTTNTYQVTTTLTPKFGTPLSFVTRDVVI